MTQREGHTRFTTEARPVCMRHIQHHFLNYVRGTSTTNSQHFRNSTVFSEAIPRPLSRVTSMADALKSRTNPLYAKDGQLHEHTASISSIRPLSSLPEGTQALFKPPADTTPYILITSETIFHAQGGGQPSDTGTITCSDPDIIFNVHQVRKPDEGAILHMGSLGSSSLSWSELVSASEKMVGANGRQDIDVPKRLLHSRIHTAGHVIGLAINQLVKEGKLPEDLKDGKASHYPGAAFVEFTGLIPGTAKDDIQARVDGM